MQPSYLSRLTLRQLRTFLAVCQQESYSRAAEELALTQPAVSAQIRQLEELIGEPLFDYLGRQLYLTPVGRALQSAAQDLLQRLVHLEMELAELRGVMQGSLALAIESSAQYFMPEIIAAFCRRHPAVDIQLRVFNHAQVLRGLQENRHDLAVMSQVPEDRGLHFIPFRENRLIAVAPPDHAVLGAGLNLLQLGGEVLLMREPGSGTRLALETHCQAQGVRLTRQRQLGSLEAVKAGVQAGLGLAVLPEDCCRAELADSRLARLEVQGLPLRRSWCVVRVRGRHLTPVAEAFLEALVSP